MGMEIVQLIAAVQPIAAAQLIAAVWPHLPVQTLLAHPAVPPPQPQHLEAGIEVVGVVGAGVVGVDADPSRGEIIDLHSHLSARRYFSFGTRCTLVVHSPLHSFLTVLFLCEFIRPERWLVN
jgi:hypothetical protein